MGSLKGGHRAFLGPQAPLCAFITVARQNETHLRVCVGGSIIEVDPFFMPA